jgi:hypothetical protein
MLLVLSTAEVMRRMKVCHIKSTWQGNAPRRLELYENASLRLFLPENPVRKVMFRIVDDRRFDYIIITLICVSAILMAYEHPHMTDTTVQVRAVSVCETVWEREGERDRERVCVCVRLSR